MEGLYKLRIRESDKLKTVLELYDLEIQQKKLGPDYHRLKTMVKRSIEQNIRNNNFGARNGHYERNAVVKNQGTKQRVQRVLGDCWQGQGAREAAWKLAKSVLKLKEHERSTFFSLSENGCLPASNLQVGKWLHCRARITLEELAITHSVKDGILQNACSTKTRMVAVLGKSAHTHTSSG